MSFSEDEIVSFLENYKAEIIGKTNGMCEGLKYSRIAEMYVAYGKYGDSLEYFEKALVSPTSNFLSFDKFTLI